METSYQPPTAIRSYGKHVLYMANGIGMVEADSIVGHTLGLTLNGEPKGTWRIIKRYIEETVKRTHVRPELADALILCQTEKAKLILPKMGHLASTLNFIIPCLESGVPIIGCDIGGHNHIEMGLLVRLSEQNRKKISDSVKKKHAQLKEQGVLLGSPSLDLTRELAYQENRKLAKDFAEIVLPIVVEIEAKGATTLVEIAHRLNERNIPSRRGGIWHASSVRNLLKRRK